MSDLAEFLLARIAEDEASAQCEQVPIPPDRDPVTGEWRTVPGAHKPGDRQKLAECYAKREIIETCSRYIEDGVTSGAYLGREVLNLLALPYTDHPDFREEWRP